MVIFDDIKNNEKIYLYAGDLKQWTMVSVEKRFELTDKKWIGLTLPKYGENGYGKWTVSWF